MKVICVDDDIENVRRCRKSIVVVGRVYTVIDECKDEEGDWYELAEDKGYEYQKQAFIPLSNISETEFQRNYKRTYS